jgi:hypothetical protein
MIAEQFARPAPSLSARPASLVAGRHVAATGREGIPHDWRQPLHSRRSQHIIKRLNPPSKSGCWANAAFGMNAGERSSHLKDPEPPEHIGKFLPHRNASNWFWPEIFQHAAHDFRLRLAGMAVPGSGARAESNSITEPRRRRPE